MPAVAKRKLTIADILPYLFIIVGAIGCIASFALTYDKIQVLQNPDYDPFCNINPVFSCGSVMKTEQASLLGMPNTIFGLVGFSMLLTFGLLLRGGAKVQRWVWVGAQISALGAIIFVHYLFFQSVFRIGAICPWCFVVWMISAPTFWYLTIYNLKEKHIKLHGFWQPAGRFMQKHHGDILLAWYAVIFAILLHQFWYYWSTLV